MPLPLESFAQTDVGLYRQNNEDSFLISGTYELFLLADGMGGHASGEVASALAIDTTKSFIAAALSQPEAPPRNEALVQAIAAANQAVFQEAGKNEAYRGMGTTFVAMLRDQTEMLIAHVGDSRCYRVRQGQLEQLTEDHSLRNFYIKEYGYTPEEAATLAESNVILRAVGLKESTMVDLCRHSLVSGDLYLLCSDGLSDYVDDPQIQAVLSYPMSLQEMAATLIGMANAAGGYDNTTVLLVRVLDET